VAGNAVKISALAGLNALLDLVAQQCSQSCKLQINAAVEAGLLLKQGYCSSRATAQAGVAQQASTHDGRGEGGDTLQTRQQHMITAAAAACLSAIRKLLKH
jgi:hypothetical protein